MSVGFKATVVRIVRSTVLVSTLPLEVQRCILMQKENFLESAPRCIGVHLQGDELVRPEMDYISNERVFTAIPRTGFVGSRASLTEEKTRRVGGAMSESLCALILVENTLLECLERERSRMRAHICTASELRNAQCLRAEAQCSHLAAQCIKAASQ